MAGLARPAQGSRGRRQGRSYQARPATSSMRPSASRGVVGAGAALAGASAAMVGRSGSGGATRGAVTTGSSMGAARGRGSDRARSRTGPTRPSLHDRWRGRGPVLPARLGASGSGRRWPWPVPASGRDGPAWPWMRFGGLRKKEKRETYRCFPLSGLV